MLVLKNIVKDYVTGVFFEQIFFYGFFVCLFRVIVPREPEPVELVDIYVFSVFVGESVCEVGVAAEELHLDERVRYLRHGDVAAQRYWRCDELRWVAAAYIRAFRDFGAVGRSEYRHVLRAAVQGQFDVERIVALRLCKWVYSGEIYGRSFLDYGCSAVDVKCAHNVFACLFSAVCLRFSSY